MRLLLSLLPALLGTTVSFATHVLGGYIQCASLPGQVNAQRITVVMYYDWVNGTTAASAAQTLSACFGDGTVANVSRVSSVTAINNSLGGTVSINRYETDHIYSGPGTYKVQAVVINRNENIRNINGSNSLNASFAIQTTVQVGLNNQTPTLTLPPAFVWPLGQRVSLLLNGTDAEGDSLSYGFALPMTNAEANPAASRYCNSFSVVAGYQYPNDVKQVGTYRLNPRTGQLTWDVPTEQGRYAADMLVSEWRNGVLISQTQQEITLVIVDQGGAGVTPPAYEPVQLATITATRNIDQEGLQLTVWPNPSASGEVSVQLTSIYATPTSLQLTDEQGHIRQATQLPGMTAPQQYQFDLSNIPAGMYLIIAESNGQRVVKKVVRL